MDGSRGRTVSYCSGFLRSIASAFTKQTTPVSLVRMKHSSTLGMFDGAKIGLNVTHHRITLIYHMYTHFFLYMCVVCITLWFSTNHFYWIILGLPVSFEMVDVLPTDCKEIWQIWQIWLKLRWENEWEWRVRNMWKGVDGRNLDNGILVVVPMVIAESVLTGHWRWWPPMNRTSLVLQLGVNTICDQIILACWQL